MWFQYVSIACDTEKGFLVMTNTVLVGTTDAGDPYVRFCEGNFVSVAPGRAATLQKNVGTVRVGMVLHI